MVMKVKRARPPKLTTKEYNWYRKGYFDGWVGNKKSVSRSQIKK